MLIVHVRLAGVASVSPSRAGWSVQAAAVSPSPSRCTAKWIVPSLPLDHRTPTFPSKATSAEMSSVRFVAPATGTT